MPRDPAREARLSKVTRGALERFLRAEPRAPRWDTLYRYLEEVDAGREPIEPLYEDLREMEEAAKRRRAAARKDAAEAGRLSEGLDLEEVPLREARRRGARVWLFHGTSSRLLRKISREGLLPTDHKTQRDTGAGTWKGSTHGYVYLTSRITGTASAETYARAAAYHFGGDPVILRVLVPAAILEHDDDDADIASGAWQYRTTEVVPPEAIRAVNEKWRRR